MDVTCDRCKTRYEFDAALVSSRGTTVKCTNCGHQFRVFRPAGSGGLAGWTVRRIDGSELRFLAMRELQSAIASGNVAESDTLVPDDGSPPQRLGAIEELRSFFRAVAAPSKPAPTTGETVEEHDTTKRHRRERGATTASPPPVLPIPKVPPPNRLAPSAPARNTMAPPVPAPLAAPERATAAPTSSSGPTKLLAGPTLGEDIDLLETNPQLPKVDLAALHATKLGSTSLGFAAPVAPPPRNTKKSSHPPEASAPPPPSEGPYQGPDLESDVKDALDRVSIAIRESIPPRDSDQGLLGSSQAEPSRAATPPRTPPPTDDAQAARLSVDAEAVRPSIDAGGGPPSVARPSVLRRTDGGDPRFSEYGRRSTRPGFGRFAMGVVAVGVAALVGVTALRKLGGDAKPTVTGVDDERLVRFLGEGEKHLSDGDVDGAKEAFAKASVLAEGEPRVLRALARVAVIEADGTWVKGRASDKVPDELGRKVERASGAVAAAAKAMPNEPGLATLQVDVLRLEGKLPEARKLVPKLGTSDPAAGRALAALELSESNPSLDTVVDRLRTAATAEKKLGQAQAMLVLALAKRNDGDAARRELDKLAEAVPGHPALEALRTLVSKGRSDTAAAEPLLDVKDALKRAKAALKKAKYDEAEKLFTAVARQAPDDADAPTGLGDIARARGDGTAAEKHYEEVLERHPKHAPALVGLGEVKWSKDDFAGALELFQRAVQAAPGTPYAEQANRRIAAAKAAKPAAPKPASGSRSPAAKPPGPKSTGAKPATPAPLPGNPEIDTSDLPGFH
jgi:predicted Zn finger-like uncharacterized protein